MKWILLFLAVTACGADKLDTNRLNEPIKPVDPYLGTSSTNYIPDVRTDLKWIVETNWHHVELTAYASWAVQWKFTATGSKSGPILNSKWVYENGSVVSNLYAYVVHEGVTNRLKLKTSLVMGLTRTYTEQVQSVYGPIIEGTAVYHDGRNGSTNIGWFIESNKAEK